MIEAMAGILGFALLFSLVGVMPLETGSCHGGECDASSAADCGSCPLLAPDADEDGFGTSRTTETHANHARSDHAW